MIHQSDKLGAGGYSEVYQADLYVPIADQTMRVAVKTLRSDPSKDLRVHPAADKRFSQPSAGKTLREPSARATGMFSAECSVKVRQLRIS